jgi:hypothetical protein
MRTLASLVIAIVLGGCAAVGDGTSPGAVADGPRTGSGGVVGGSVGGRVGVGVGASSGVSAVTPNQMRVEWEPETKGDRARVAGYVYNDYVLPARNIVLLVEGLDAGGQVTDRTRAYVGRIVTPGSRSYWEVSVPRPAAATYRVTVASVHWLAGDR